MSEQLLPDLETMNHLVARAAVRDLPDGSDFESLKTREEARPEGPRPGVLEVLERRLGIRRAEDPTGVTAFGAANNGSAVPSVRRPLPEVTWEKKQWRGFDLYACTRCPHNTFDLGEADAHARTHTSKKKE